VGKKKRNEGVEEGERERGGEREGGEGRGDEV
jgi:hypothetical protein